MKDNNKKKGNNQMMTIPFYLFPNNNVLETIS